MAPLPFDVGDIGNKITSVGNTAVKGATDVASTVTSGATDIVSTASNKVEGAIETATNQVGHIIASAADAVDELINQGQDLLGFLKLLNQLQKLLFSSSPSSSSQGSIVVITVSMIVAAVAAAVSSAPLNVRNKYKEGDPEKGDPEKGDPEKGHPKEVGWHRISKCCLKCVPKSIKHDMEKQHGNLEKGWFDPTYIARGFGRQHVPNDNIEEKVKWNWWGHEDGRMHRFVIDVRECVGKPINEELRRKMRILREKEKDAMIHVHRLNVLKEEMANAKKGWKEKRKELKSRAGYAWTKDMLAKIKAVGGKKWTEGAQDLVDEAIEKERKYIEEVNKEIKFLAHKFQTKKEK
nr:hypothetical protein L204_01201 [Cryptococcus depauperatus CBS 7855]